jgi:uncharacterized protein YecT (DUF1311 family)
MQGYAAKTGVLACAVLMLAATASRCETAKPDAADSAAVQSCIKSAADGSQRERCIGIIADPCADRPDAQSTADQVACAAREFAVWDDILNETYAACASSSTPSRRSNSGRCNARGSIPANAVARSIGIFSAAPWPHP